MLYVMNSGLKTHNMSTIEKDSKSKGSRPITLQLPIEAVELIKQAAAKEDRSMSSLIRVAISHYLQLGGAR